MAISKEQIWAAADALDAAGQSPTLSAGRTAVGAGSYTTIQEAMKEWKARRAAKDAPLAEPAPQAVADRLASFGSEVWAVAIEAANARLAVDRASLELSRAETDAARIEAVELADQLTAELEAAKGRIAALLSSEKAAKADNDQLRQRLAAAEARNGDIERHEAELRQAGEAARQSAAEARERAAELAGRLDVLERQNAELLSKLAPQDPSSGSEPRKK